MTAARGAAVLADGGEQAIVSMQVPLFAPTAVGMPGLVLPLELVEIVEAESWKALAIGVDISAQAGGDGHLSVSQTITLERHFSDAN